MSDETPVEPNPGPGTYDLNFREELKTLGNISIKIYTHTYYFVDQKYSQRYKKNPFGVRAPRFIYKSNVNKPKRSDIMIEDENLPQQPNVTRQFIDDTIEKMK